MKPLRLLGVEQSEGPHARVAHQRVPGDQTTAVVPDHRDVVEVEQVDDAPHGVNVQTDVQRDVAVEPAVPRADQVQHVAGDVRSQIRQQSTEGRAARWPAVYEDHV